MTQARRARRAQSGATNRRADVDAGGEAGPRQGPGETQELVRSKSNAALDSGGRPARAQSAGAALSKTRSAAHLRPLTRPEYTRPHLSRAELLPEKLSPKSALERYVQVSGLTECEQSAARALVDSVAENLRQRYNGKRSLRSVFLAWDVNRDGVVDPSELSGIFNKCGCAVTMPQARSICRLFGGPKEHIPYDGFIDLVFQEEEPPVPTAEQLAGEAHAAAGHAPESAAVRNLKSRLRDLNVSEREIESAAKGHKATRPLAETIKLLKVKFQAKRSLQKEFRAIDDDHSGRVSVDEMHSFLGRAGLYTTKEQLQELFSRFDKGSTKDGEVEYEEFINVVFPVEDVGAFKRLTPRRSDEQEAEAEAEARVARARARAAAEAARKKKALLDDDEDEHSRARPRVAGADTTDLVRRSVSSGLRDALRQARVRRNIAKLVYKEFDTFEHAFRSLDHSGSGQISYAAFSNALAKLKVDIRPGELEVMLRHIDADGSGTIDFDEFRRFVNEARTGGEGADSSGVGQNALGLDRAPTSDEAARNSKTATQANIGHALSNRAPNRIETSRLRIKRKLFPDRRDPECGPAQPSQLAPLIDLAAAPGDDYDDERVERCVGASRRQPLGGAHSKTFSSVPFGSSPTTRSKIHVAVPDKPGGKSSSSNNYNGSNNNNNSLSPPRLFDVNDLKRKLVAPRRDGHSKAADTTYLIRPAPGAEGVEGIYTYKGGESGRFRTENNRAFTLDESAAYRNSDERQRARAQQDRRYEIKREQQLRYVRDEPVRVQDDPDLRLKTVLKQRLNYFARMDEILLKQQERRPPC